MKIIGRFKETLSQTTRNFLSNEISYCNKDCMNDEFEICSVALKLTVNPIKDLPAAIRAL
jgi:hypothetical protein